MGTCWYLAEGMEARVGLRCPVLAEGSSFRFWMIFSSIREMTLLLTLCVETVSVEPLDLWLSVCLFLSLSFL